MTHSFTLAAFGGSPAPDGLAADLLALLSLPEPVRDALWEVLARNLGATLPPGVEAFVASFCQAHGIAEDGLVPIVRGCRLLFRQGASRDVAVADVTRDLNLLCGTEPEVVGRITAWYERALPLIRSMLAVDGLGDFGPVLEDVRVRTSYLRASRHLPQALIPLVTLSLRYKDGDDARQLSLSLPPQLIEQLRAVVSELPG